MCKVGIVLQGPLTYAQQIADCYSGFKNIVISTWEDEPPFAIKLLQSHGFQVLLNKKPAISGHWNTNFQCESVAKGISYFESKRDIAYIIKIRSDILLYNLDELIGYVKLHQTQIAACGYSFNCNYNDFHIHDFIVLGTLQKMKVFWTHEVLETNGQPYPERWLLNKYLGLPENYCFRNRWAFNKKIVNNGWILRGFRWQVDFLKHEKYNKYFAKSPVVVIPGFAYWLEVQLRSVHRAIFSYRSQRKALS